MLFLNNKQDEVRHRRDEFARLLDEHEQVVKELRRIESAGELQQQVATNADGVIKPITEWKQQMKFTFHQHNDNIFFI